jgi:hypothetical protein
MMKEYLSFTKDVLVILLLVLLCWTTVRCIVFVDVVQNQVTGIGSKTYETINTSNTVLRDIQATTKLQKALFENEKNQQAIGLALRSGENFLRMSQIGVDIMRQVKKDTLPLSTELLIKIGDAVVHIDSGTTATLNETALIAKQINALLNSNELREVQLTALSIAKNVESTTKNIDTTSKFTEEQIKQHLPLLLVELERITSNTANIAHEIEEFVKKINKPATLKEKIFRALVLALSVASPVIIQNLKR